MNPNEQMNQDGQNPQQQYPTGQQTAPQKPLYEAASPQNVLNKGNMILSFASMITSFIALFKRIFPKS